MNSKATVSRGIERLICQREGATIGAMHGLAGMGCANTFNGLAGLLKEAQFENVGDHVAKLRRTHARLCSRVNAALPAAVEVKKLVEATSGPDAKPVSAQLGALGASAAKIAKSIAKVQAREAKQEAKVAKKIAKYTAAGKAAKVAKVVAKNEKQNAKVAAKLVKLGNKLAAAQAKVASALTPTTVTTPSATAAAVLADQSGVALPADMAAQFVSSGGGGSSGGGLAPLESAPQTAESDGTILGMSPLMAAGVGAGALGVLYLVTKKRGRG
jgi:DNA polymerase III gamma/tau subunit